MTDLSPLDASLTACEFELKWSATHRLRWVYQYTRTYTPYFAKLWRSGSSFFRLNPPLNPLDLRLVRCKKDFFADVISTAVATGALDSGNVGPALRGGVDA